MQGRCRADADGMIPKLLEMVMFGVEMYQADAFRKSIFVITGGSHVKV